MQGWMEVLTVLLEVKELGLVESVHLQCISLKWYFMNHLLNNSELICFSWQFPVFFLR